MFELMGKRMDPSVVEAALGRVKFTDDPHESTFRTFGSWAYELGFEHKPVDLAALLDVRALSKLRAAAP
jgi:hypothetical protein